MNQMFNTHLNGMGAPGFCPTKKTLSMQPESLFSMALYDFDSYAHMEPGLQNPPAFHPVDEYKDLSLKEILDLSDDFLFGDDEPNMMQQHHQQQQQQQQLQHQNNIPMNQLNLFNRLPHQPLLQTPANRPDYQALGPRSDAVSQLIPQMEPTPLANTVTPSRKRCREGSDYDSDSDEDRERRFRPYQAGQWAEKYEELCEYRERTGHCLVPHTYKENLPLARWVKRQRYQYKLMMEAKPSTMTPERVKALEDIGFVWDSQGAAWGERLDELREFAKVYMHCNVPSNFSENPQLATWVKCQRRQYKLHMEGKPSNMTPQRVQELEKLGFEWELRTYKKIRS